MKALRATARIAALVAMAAGAVAPASAQFFYKAPALAGEAVTGAEPSILALPLADAKPEELRAALLWNMRAALNVAALQCQFEPTLLTLSSYNAMISNHDDELKKAYDTLTNYFKRTKGSVKAGQSALDSFGTKTYIGFSTVAAQYTFCQAAGEVVRDALFAPEGQLYKVAEMRLRKLRNSLVPSGEQGLFFRMPQQIARVPSMDKRCWTRMDEWRSDKCPLGNGSAMAAR